MKLLFFILFSVFVSAQSTSIEAIRTAYPTAGFSKENAKKFSTLVSKSGSGTVASGYQAAAQIIQAKFESNDRAKIVKSGIKSLENVVKSAPDNLEVRMIRLSIQENLPGIVGYKANMKEDKAFIIRNFEKQNTSLKTYIKGFIQNSKSFSAAEKSSFK